MKTRRANEQARSGYGVDVCLRLLGKMLQVKERKMWRKNRLCLLKNFSQRLASLTDAPSMGSQIKKNYNQIKVLTGRS